MTRERRRAGLVVVATLMPLMLTAVACRGHREQQMLSQFFRAASARDNRTWR